MADLVIKIKVERERKFLRYMLHTRIMQLEEN
jgi:hypothetical protein